jgi:hypothetical protein
LCIAGSTVWHVILHQQQMMPLFHCVRDGIASTMIVFSFLAGSFNPADILSKH